MKRLQRCCRIRLINLIKLLQDTLVAWLSEMKRKRLEILCSLSRNMLNFVAPEGSAREILVVVQTEEPVSIYPGISIIHKLFGQTLLWDLSSIFNGHLTESWHPDFVFSCGNK